MPDDAAASADAVLARVRGAFPALPLHLDAATAGLPAEAGRRAMHDAIDRWAAGDLDPLLHDEQLARSRHAAAALLGVPASDVAAGTGASPFVALAVAAVPDGGTVLVADGEFTSVLFPVLSEARRRGLQVRSRPVEQLVEAVAADVDLVCVSAVQSADGRRIDLDALAATAAAHDTLTLVDATQAAGWTTIDAGRFDMTVTGGYKWLCCPRGTAFATVRPSARERIPTLMANWYAGENPWASCYGTPLRQAADARRYDLSPAWICWAGAAPALEAIAEAGPDVLGRHGIGLADDLRRRLGAGPAGSAIVALRGDGIAEALAAAGIRAAGRAGRTRISFHFWNDGTSVDAALAALDGLAVEVA